MQYFHKLMGKTGTVHVLLKSQIFYSLNKQLSQAVRPDIEQMGQVHYYC